MSGTVYTKDVLALSDHLFERFPTLSGLEILAIAAETVEFYNSRGRETGNHLGERDPLPDPPNADLSAPGFGGVNNYRWYEEFGVPS